jgi:hypothetical protein
MMVFGHFNNVLILVSFLCCIWFVFFGVLVSFVIDLIYFGDLGIMYLCCVGSGMELSCVMQ